MSTATKVPAPTLVWVFPHHYPYISLLERGRYSAERLARIFERRGYLGYGVRTDRFHGYVALDLTGESVLVRRWCVPPGDRARHVEQELIHKILNKLVVTQRRTAVFPVRENDVPLQLLLRDTYGFRATGIKPATRENPTARYVMTYERA